MNLLRRIFRKQPKSTKPELSLYEERIGSLKVHDLPDSSLVSYDKDGAFDYATYKAIQQAGNERKLDDVFVDEAMIAQIATFVAEKGLSVGTILCHGTRNGAEQRFFRKHIPSANMVVGTEISNTANRFPDTIQWDFHDVDPAWSESIDILYSNSWDHSYDPEKLFRAWGSCLSADGLMFLEHTNRHTADQINALDPFGTTLEGLKNIVTNVNEGKIVYVGILDDSKDEHFERQVAIFARS